MNRVWERGLDPETATDEEPATDGDGIYRPPQRGERGAGAGAAAGTGDRAVPAGREGLARGVPRNVREDWNRSRNGAPVPGAGAGGVRGRGRREYDGGAAGVVEPEAKRPRVTSAIVVPGAAGAAGKGIGGDGDDENRARFRDDGELDRWNAGPGPMDMEMDESGEPGGKAEDRDARASDVPVTEGGEEETTEAAEGPEEDEGQKPRDRQQQPRFGGKIVVVSSTLRGRRSDREVSHGVMRVDRGAATGGVPGRFRPGVSRGCLGRAEPRGSIASRLGPMVGPPVAVGGREGEGGQGGDGENGEGGEPLPPHEKPMVEPSKPELQAAYKDGDTKKRNRRWGPGGVALTLAVGAVS